MLYTVRDRFSIISYTLPDDDYILAIIDNVNNSADVVYVDPCNDVYNCFMTVDYHDIYDECNYVDPEFWVEVLKRNYKVS